MQPTPPKTLNELLLEATSPQDLCKICTLHFREAYTRDSQMGLVKFVFASKETFSTLPLPTNDTKPQRIKMLIKNLKLLFSKSEQLLSTDNNNSLKEEPTTATPTGDSSSSIVMKQAKVELLKDVSLIVQTLTFYRSEFFEMVYQKSKSTSTDDENVENFGSVFADSLFCGILSNAFRLFFEFLDDPEIMDSSTRLLKNPGDAFSFKSSLVQFRAIMNKLTDLLLQVITEIESSADDTPPELTKIEEKDNQKEEETEMTTRKEPHFLASPAIYSIIVEIFEGILKRFPPPVKQTEGESNTSSSVMQHNQVNFQLDFNSFPTIGFLFGIVQVITFSPSGEKLFATEHFIKDILLPCLDQANDQDPINNVASVLRNLAYSPSAQEYLTNEETVNILLKALTRTKSLTWMEGICGVISNLCIDNQKIKQMFFKHPNLLDVVEMIWRDIFESFEIMEEMTAKAAVVIEGAICMMMDGGGGEEDENEMLVVEKIRKMRMQLLKEVYKRNMRSHGADDDDDEDEEETEEEQDDEDEQSIVEKMPKSPYVLYYPDPAVAMYSVSDIAGAVKEFVTDFPRSAAIFRCKYFVESFKGFELDDPLVGSGGEDYIATLKMIS